MKKPALSRLFCFGFQALAHARSILRARAAMVGDGDELLERQPFTTQASIGISTAHRNGLERAQAEQNISQPMVGSAQAR